MAFGISIKAPGHGGVTVRELWKQFGRFEAVPSMSGLEYPPHLTLAVYDAIAEQQLRAALRAVFLDSPGIRLRFSRIAVFDAPRPVFWAAPDDHEALARAHAAVHRALPVKLCREYYRPGCWIPHCTLATAVRADRIDEAKAFAAGGFEPFEVEFSVADCVEFYPVRVIDEVPLPGSV